MSKNRKLSTEEAQRKIRLIADEGFVQVGFHCKQRMVERNVTLDDIMKVLTAGIVVEEGEWDEDRGNWKYRVEGTDIEGDDLTAISIILEAEFQVFIKTVF